jgi:hypothetical protein
MNDREIESIMLLLCYNIGIQTHSFGYLYICGYINAYHSFMYKILCFQSVLDTILLTRSEQKVFVF